MKWKFTMILTNDFLKSLNKKLNGPSEKVQFFTLLFSSLLVGLSVLPSLYLFM